jgi:hypothetical protein
VKRREPRVTTVGARARRRYRVGVQARVVVIGILAMCSGCVAGGRFTGGVLAGDGGTTGFLTATFQIGMVDKKLSRLTLEAGETLSDRAPATHVGVRYDAAHDDRAASTSSIAVEYGRGGAYVLATTGIAYQEATLEHESPDVLGGGLWAVAIEGIAGIGGRRASDLGVRFGAQLSFEYLWFGIMR